MNLICGKCCNQQIASEREDPGTPSLTYTAWRSRLLTRVRSRTAGTGPCPREGQSRDPRHMARRSVALAAATGSAKGGRAPYRAAPPSLRPEPPRGHLDPAGRRHPRGPTGRGRRLGASRPIVTKSLASRDPEVRGKPRGNAQLEERPGRAPAGQVEVSGRAGTTCTGEAQLGLPGQSRRVWG